MSYLTGLGAALIGLDLLAKARARGRNGALAGTPHAASIGQLGAPRAKLSKAPTIEARIREIKRLARKSGLDPNVRRAAMKMVTKKCGYKDDGSTKWCIPERDWRGEAVALFNFVRNEVRYTRDPTFADAYTHARRTLEDFHGGDCLPQGTLILRAPGHLVPIEQIESGDTIMGDGAWSRVANVCEKGERELLRFDLNNGSSFACTPEHRVFRVRRTKHGASGVRTAQEEARADEIRPGDDLLQPETLPFGRESIGLDRALIMGAYIAEGWVEPHRIGISGVPAGKGVREAVVAAARRLSINVAESPRYIRLYGDDICRFVGACGKLAADKRLPHVDFDEETVRGLLRGIDADGGRATSGTFVFSTTSPLLALQYRVLHRMLGQSCHVRCVVKHGGFGKKPIFRVTVRSGEARNAKPWARVLSIGDGGSAPTYDLTTESGRIYLPESDVVVHNCDDGVIALTGLLLSIGHTPRLRTYQTQGYSDWNHIALTVGLPPHKPTTWLPLDPSVAMPAGWEVPSSQIIKKWDFDV